MCINETYTINEKHGNEKQKAMGTYRKLEVEVQGESVGLIVPLLRSVG